MVHREADSRQGSVAVVASPLALSEVEEEEEDSVVEGEETSQRRWLHEGLTGVDFGGSPVSVVIVTLGISTVS